MISKGLFMGAGIIMELAGLVLLGKALATGASPTLGIMFVAGGLLTLVGARAIKAKNGQDVSG